MNARVPPPLTWHIFQIIVNFFGLIVSTCISNQSKAHWLLFDALNTTMSMSLKFKDEIDSPTFDNLMDENENVVYELSCLASNIKKQNCLGFGFFFFLLKKIWRKKAHNMFFFMLDPRFKTLHLVSSLIGREQCKVIVDKYDKKPLFPMF